MASTQTTPSRQPEAQKLHPLALKSHPCTHQPFPQTTSTRQPVSQITPTRQPVTQTTSTQQPGTLT